MSIEAPLAELGSAAYDYSLLEHLPIMAWTAGPDGKLDFVNQQCTTFTGLPREQLLSGGVTAAVHPDQGTLAPKLRARLAEQAPFELEHRVRRYDGEFVRCLARVNPIRDRHGRLVKWLGSTIVLEDIRRTADRLIQEEHLQLALESADVGIWRLRLPSNELTVDERTRRHLDLDSHVIQNYNPQDIIHPEDYARSASQEPDANGRLEVEHRVRHRDGTYRWQAIHWRRWCEGEGTDTPTLLITGTSMDITARKEAEAEREELRQRYRIALAAAELGTWSLDLESRTLQLDDRARGHLSLDEASVTPAQCAERIHPLDRRRTLQTIRQQLRKSTRKPRSTVEFRVQSDGDEEVRWIAAQFQVNLSASRGRAQRIIGVTRDITKQKQADEKVRRVNSELERRVQQRTVELTAANEELESFAYAVSHDLRGPLRAMWGFSQALIEDFGDVLPPQAHDYLQHVIDGSRHLGEIIDGLLTLSRSTRGTLRRDVVDLSAVAEKLLREFARVEPQRRVTWTIESGLRVQGDSRMIDAVMRNLLGNAWKYTANRDDAEIHLYSEQTGNERVFCVADNGAGFNMEHNEKLFQPFQRLHRQDEFSGLGIGLATVQRIIHRHGGKVSGIGVPGEGAVFRFSLPTPDELVTTHTKRESDP